jgi:hypothetical protein
VLNDDAILDASILYTEAEVLAEFQECCELEVEASGEHTERLNRAAADLCQMQSRNKPQSDP